MGHFLKTAFGNFQLKLCLCLYYYKLSAIIIIIDVITVGIMFVGVHELITFESME